MDDIFLNQGKYTIEILKRFGMLDCKAMATPMVSNLKLLLLSHILARGSFSWIWPLGGKMRRMRLKTH
jgi:hypothetical protein